MKLKTETRKIINDSDWDDLVRDTYGKPYRFQQQDGCQDRGTVYLKVPAESYQDEIFDEIPLEINSDEMCVKFDVWLNTDPQTHKEKMNWSDHDVELFWERNFYPDIADVANDLLVKGLIEPGEYNIEIDW